MESKVNGINKYKFNTIGTPKITGSLLLNKFGTKANFLNPFKEVVFAKNEI